MGLILGSSGGATLDGDLARDGSATTSQISLIVENLNSLSQSATAEVRARVNSPQGTWADWQPLHRVQPGDSPTPPWAGGVEDVFAGVIFDLEPGETYDVELRKTLGISVDDGNISQFTTRSLPSETLPTVTTTITDGTSNSAIQTAINGAAADAGSNQIYILFENGSYDLSNIDWPSNISGDSDSLPTFVRGESRLGVLVTHTGDDAMFELDNDLDDVVFENFTHRGIGTDGTANNGGASLLYSPGSADLNNITFRNITATGLRRGVYSRGPINETANSAGILVYDCTLIGTLVWNETNLRTSGYSWDHYAVLCAGEGHEYFNNYLELFGDVFSVVSGGSGERSEEDKNQFFYRNRVDKGMDDCVEADDGYRNIGVYDNIITNTTNLISADLLYGGPIYVARNCCANILEVRMLKLNDDCSGILLANNTLMLAEQIYRSDAPNDNIAIYYQPSGATVSQLAMGNNLFIRPNSTPTDENIWFDATTNQWEIFNNAWYPDNSYLIGTVDENNLANAQSNAPAADGFLYYPSVQWFDGDVVAVAQPLATTFTFGTDAFVEFPDTLSFADFAASDSSIQNAGRAIAGITNRFTEGFSGASPDMGANISGLTEPSVGDRDNSVPLYAIDLDPLDVRQLTGSYAPVSGNEAMEDVTPQAWIDEDTGGPGRTFFGVISAYSGGSGAIIDGAAIRRLTVHGGGHNDSGNNGFYIYDFTEASRQPTGWEDGVDISANNIVTAGTSSTHSDGRPRSVHTYSGGCYAPDTDLFYRAGGSLFVGSGQFTPDFWEYDPTAAQGSRWTQLTDVPGNSDDGMCAVYDETEGKVIVVDSGAGAWVYDIGAGTWSSESGLTLFDNFDVNGGYDPTRNVVLITMDNENAQAITFDLSDDTVSAQSTITWTGDTTVANETCAKIFDAELDRWWFFGGAASGNYDTIAYCDGADLASGGNVAVTELSLSANTASTGFEEAIIGTFNRFTFDEDARIVYTVHRTDEAPWVIRLPSV